MTKYNLKLYITGKTPESEKAIDELKKILEKNLKGKYKLEVIDIEKNPQLAEDEKILATPLVEKKLPPPVKRVIGKLADEEKVLLGLDLVTDEEKSKKKSKKKKSSKKKNKDKND